MKTVIYRRIIVGSVPKRLLRIIDKAVDILLDDLRVTQRFTLFIVHFPMIVGEEGDEVGTPGMFGFKRTSSGRDFSHRVAIATDCRAWIKAGAVANRKEAYRQIIETLAHEFRHVWQYCYKEKRIADWRSVKKLERDADQYAARFMERYWDELCEMK